jgi:GH43 family beta-xylosidase
MALVPKDDAVEIARRAASAKGLPWVEPTHVVQRTDEFEISTNADVLGGNVIVIVDRLTGEVR